MKRIFVAVGLSLLLGTSALAKTPKEVIEPYKAYRAAMADNDAKVALKQAKLAWDAAETHLGDHKTTGDLAQNYADIRFTEEVSKLQIKAMERALELSSYYGADANEMYLQRGVKLAQYHMTNEDSRKTNKLTKELIKFAKDNKLDRSVFYAEVLTLKAGAMVPSRNGKRMLELTEEALNVFSNPSEPYDTPYPILANLYHGFAYEYEDNVFDAALSYQKVMEYVGDLDYNEHPIVGRALGRWSHMRTRLQTSGEYDEALKSGLCECWPYDVERNESVKPITRVPPLFPRKALRSGVSGYTIVQFDLDDEGNTINPKAIVSWPPDLYEEAALESLGKWEYSPRAEGETDADRINLITTIRFQIQDKSGNPIY